MNSIKAMLEKYKLYLLECLLRPTDEKIETEILSFEKFLEQNNLTTN